MRTDLPRALLGSEEGQRADAILRSCVHCGFCNATCPTYLIEGDELDGPRGRIYLIKEMLETGVADSVTRTHLDRCLTCRSCETTCPSGVKYGELLELGRETLENAPVRGLRDRLVRWGLRRIVPYPSRFRPLVAVGRAFRWLLPRRLRAAVPPRFDYRPVTDAVPAARRSDAGRVVLLEGCVQRVATQGVNAALRALLAARGVEVVTVREEGCCGGLALHLGARADADSTMGRLLDALEPHLDGIDAILSTASGCGVTIKDYGRLFAHDAERAPLARRVAELTRDVAEYLATLPGEWARDPAHARVAWHPPCTLQHGQRVTGVVERLLRQAGYDLVPVRDAHLCCGSAGTYSLLEPARAERLGSAKRAALLAANPDIIATANIGCQLHLSAARPAARLGANEPVPVRHWIELLR
jgi:glycolate oxidase iron-sulfur subunit